MNICGILVNIKPENKTAVSELINSIPGFEVHAVSPEGQMVVTLEEVEEDNMADKLFSIQDFEGVISASMIYHHNEDEGTNEDEESKKVEEVASNNIEKLSGSIT
jgi:nitrate reductase NapD